MKAKKKYGQNFLIDEGIINKIVADFSIEEDDLIIEIGPGRGALTKKLIKNNNYLIAFEIDQDMRTFLDKLENQKVKIIYQDILLTNIKEIIKKIPYQKLYIVGNLPYYITTPIIEHIIEQDLDFEKLVVMVQKEVADRFLATPKSKDYGYITLFLQYYFKSHRVCDVSKYAFSPVPKVESSVVCFQKRAVIPNINIEEYKKFLKQCFSFKRKTLKNNLHEYDWTLIKSVLDKRNININVRAEELEEEVIIDIFNNLK